MDLDDNADRIFVMGVRDAYPKILNGVQRAQWLEALARRIDEELVVSGIGVLTQGDDPAATLSKIIGWHCQVALDPAVSSDAAALVKKGWDMAIASMQSAVGEALRSLAGAEPSSYVFADTEVVGQEPEVMPASLYGIVGSKPKPLEPGLHLDSGEFIPADQLPAWHPV
ncbi:MAG: hypothetical protein Q7U48_13820 [Hydrogenophaga sp.]|nr:hypothetical protein [Hydrogenophaga sp.]